MGVTGEESALQQAIIFAEAQQVFEVSTIDVLIRMLARDWLSQALAERDRIMQTHAKVKP